jgi:hypothetical protein
VRIRVGKIGKVFKHGESELYVALGRIAVFYEDLQLEMGEFRKIHASYVAGAEEGSEYRMIYFIRRVLSTLMEFRSALTTVRITKEFKSAESSLQSMYANHIVEADRYFQQHGKQIKELRNEFGGHLQSAGVKFALRNLDDTVGRISWGSSDGWTMGLDCGFAGHIAAGTICSMLPHGDVRDEYAKVSKVLADGFFHVNKSSMALVRAFLWERFG